MKDWPKRLVFLYSSLTSDFKTFLKEIKIYPEKTINFLLLITKDPIQTD